MTAKPLHTFGKNDKITIRKLLIYNKKREIFEAMGLYEGCEAEIIFKHGKKIILKIGNTKLALTEKISENILAYQSPFFCRNSAMQHE